MLRNMRKLESDKTDSKSSILINKIENYNSSEKNPKIKSELKS